MRFVEDQIQFKLYPKEQKLNFVQHIYSETTLNNKSETYELEKEFQLTSKPISNNKWEVFLKTEKDTPTLPSIYRKQQYIKRQISGCLHELNIQINILGSIVCLNNHSEIIGKWYTIRKQIEKQITGKTLDNYLDGVEKKIKNHDLLIGDLNQYRLFGLLFNQLHAIPHGGDDLAKNNMRKRTINNAVYEFPLDIEEKIKLKRIDHQNAFLKIEGFLAQDQERKNEIDSLFERKGLMYKENVQLDLYKGNYVVCIGTGTVQRANLLIETSYGNNYKKFQEYSLAQL